jgi:hypothetical protein
LTRTLEWLLALPQTRLGFKQLLRVQIFALLYVIYTMIRAATTGWYPFRTPKTWVVVAMSRHTERRSP